MHSNWNCIFSFALIFCRLFVAQQQTKKQQDWNASRKCHGKRHQRQDKVQLHVNSANRKSKRPKQRSNSQESCRMLLACSAGKMEDMAIYVCAWQSNSIHRAKRSKPEHIRVPPSMRKKMLKREWNWHNESSFKCVCACAHPSNGKRFAAIIFLRLTIK